MSESDSAVNHTFLPLAAASHSAIPTTNVPIDLSAQTGALFIGLSIALVLWGMQTLQMMWYYLHYPQDPCLLKLLVAILCILSTLDVGFSFTSVWDEAIRNSGIYPNPFAQGHLFSRIFVYGLVGFFSQLFFLYRIIKFADAAIIRYGVPLLLLPLMIYQLIANMVYVAIWLHTDPGSDFISGVFHALAATKVWVVSSYVAASVTDIVIALVLSYLLLKQRSGIARTDRLLVKISVTSINTGTWTAIDALATVILTLTAPKSSSIYAIPSWFASPLYVNTVLCNLNVRQFFRASLEDSTFNWLSTLHIGTPSRMHFLRSTPQDPDEDVQVELPAMDVPSEMQRSRTSKP